MNPDKIFQWAICIAISLIMVSCSVGVSIEILNASLRP